MNLEIRKTRREGFALSVSSLRSTLPDFRLHKNTPAPTVYFPVCSLRFWKRKIEEGERVGLGFLKCWDYHSRAQSQHSQNPSHPFRRSRRLPVPSGFLAKGKHHNVAISHVVRKIVEVMCGMHKTGTLFTPPQSEATPCS